MAPEGAGATSDAVATPLSERVLLVEDEAHVRRAVARMLDRLGFETEAVGTAREAVGLLHSGDFDVLILDFMLPEGRTGVQVITVAPEERPDLPVRLCTGYTDLGIGQIAPDTPILGKPFGSDELPETLASLRAGHER